MAESVRVHKTIACSCGRDYSLELATELGLNSVMLELECPGCSARFTVTLEALLRNKPAAKAEASGLGENPLAFMETPESTRAGEAQASSTSASGERSPLEELFEEEL
ncbi:MAG: hypothetical protein QXH27_05390 [Candidatus Micrarchaeia archaeon]